MPWAQQGTAGYHVGSCIDDDDDDVVRDDYFA